MEWATDLPYTYQGPTKRLKTKVETSSLSPAGATDQGCATEIDIEDLHDARCILVCAPVVPSQSEQDYPLSSTFDGTYDPIEKLAHFYPPARKFAGESSQRTRTQTQTQQRKPRPRSRLHSRLSSPSSPSQPGHDPNESSSQCLLERVNPDYFGRDKYKWHSSMEQVPVTSGMMSIDPESAQDFTTLYTADKTALKNRMSHLDVQTPGHTHEWALPELDNESSSSRSAHSSPDALLQTLPFDAQSLGNSIFELNALEDVNQMFDWDEACAALVDEEIPNYKTNELATHRVVPYSTSAFRSIPTIASNPSNPPKHDVGSGAHPSCSSPLLAASLEKGLDVLHGYASSPSHAGDEEEGPVTVCHNCGITKTPLWRRTPDKRHSLCNACGLYLKQYQIMRPLVPRNRSQATRKDEENTVCTNCEATKTSLWRKDENGQVICNACGLYHKLHGKARPVTMRKEKVSRRKRYRNLPPESPEASRAAILPMAPPVTVPQHLVPQPQMTGPIQA